MKQGYRFFLLIIVYLTGYSSCASLGWEWPDLAFWETPESTILPVVLPSQMIRKDPRGEIISKVFWTYDTQGEIQSEIHQDAQGNPLQSKEKRILEDGRIRWNIWWNARQSTRKTITTLENTDIESLYEVLDPGTGQFTATFKEILRQGDDGQWILELQDPRGQVLGRTIYQFSDSGNLLKQTLNDAAGSLLEEYQRTYSMGEAKLMSIRQFSPLGELKGSTQFVYQDQSLSEIQKQDQNGQILQKQVLTYTENGLLVKEILMDQENEILESREILYSQEGL